MSYEGSTISATRIGGGGITDAEFDALDAPAIPQAFPVGAVFIAVVGTNPATLLGYGTWSAIAAGRVLIGLNSGDADFDAAEETGGAKTVAGAGSVAAPTISGSTAAEAAHTHPVTSNVAVANHVFTQPTFTGNSVTSSAVSGGTPAGTNSAPAFTGNSVTSSAVTAGTPAGTNSSTSISASGTSPFTVDDVSAGTQDPLAVSSHTHPSHTHTFTGSALATHTHTTTATGSVAAPTFTGSALGTHTHTTTATGTNTSGAVDAHSVTNNAVTSGAGSSHLHAAGTLAASAPAYTGSATSVVQPYFVVYMWKRTA